jgi:hypothetical protein
MTPATLTQPAAMMSPTKGMGTPTPCAQCSAPTVRIGFNVAGENVAMFSCSVCETRSWSRSGQQVDLDGVLHGLTSVGARYCRDLSTL